MISIFLEAALRSLVAGLAVAVGLRLFRVRNVLAQKAAWGLVLVSAVAMPLLLPVTARLHLLPPAVSVVLPARPMTLLEELQARIQAKSGSESQWVPPIEPIPQSDAAKAQASPAPEQPRASRAPEQSSRTTRTRRAAKPERATTLLPGRSADSSALSMAYTSNSIQGTQQPAAIARFSASAVVLVLILYCGISALFLVRIGLGLLTTMRLWRTATPVAAHQLPQDASSLRIRASQSIASPLTVGSGILLPADFATWDSDKLRIVLAHERSHVRQCDFYLQVLAGLYAALVWISPLGWWLKHELADLAEAISDRAAMEEAASCAAYAQILLEFAAAPRRASLGVAMARPGSLSRRIERLLNDRLFRQCFAGGRRALLSVALVPLALFACTAMVRVDAASSAQPAAPAPAAAPSALAARALAPAPAPAPSAFPLPEPAPAAPDLGRIEVNEQALSQLPTETPAIPAIIPELKLQAMQQAAQMIAAAAPAPVVPTAPLMAMAAGRRQEDSALSFDRTLAASGGRLEVSTGSGDIRITRSAGNQIQIHGHIHVSHGGSEQEARQIAANPPIEQSGDAIRVGEHQQHWHGISIDYQIEAPAGTLLTANSGSGDIVDEGVGQNAKLETGSGDIRASGLQGPFTVKTGSGNIHAEQSAQGDVVAETGSGDIELKDIHGSFQGHTGSGDIKASGTPSAPWNLQTGSGDIELWTGNAPVTLDVSTGSGTVSTDHEMMVQGSFDHHHIRGTLNGGGPAIRAETGSGEVHIH